MTLSIYLLFAALLCSVILAKEIPKLPSVRRTSDAVIYTIFEEETITIEETIEIFGEITPPVITSVLVNKPKCGAGPQSLVRRINSDNRIINGVSAQKNSWPSTVFLNIYIDEKHHGICGGTLLDNYHVLTAAHCFNKTEPSQIKIFLGLHTVRPAYDAKETRNASRLIIHQNYNNDTQENDIAIIKMSKPVKFSSKISPVCLPENDFEKYEDVDVAVVGWGLIQQTPEKLYPDDLQQVTLKTMSNKDCEKKFGAKISKGMLCATTDYYDSCGGDSGGPVYYKTDADDKWTQIGVVSFGMGPCGHTDYPGVYARVSSYLNWIKKYISQKY